MMVSSQWPVRVGRNLQGLLARWRGRTGPLPDFLCIGAQRAGTTTLHHLLAGHADVHVPKAKELHYFTLHADRSLAWYRGQFRAASRGQLVGESTPYYLYHESVPHRVAKVLPCARLLVLLRDPVERALSGYFHSRRLALEPLELEAALAAEEERLRGAEEAAAVPGARHHAHQHHSYLRRSRYEVQLARWLAHFPRNQLLVLRSEDLFARPGQAWEQVQRFLELPVRPPTVRHVASNGGQGEAGGVSRAVRRLLRERLALTYDALAREFGIRWDSDGGQG